MSDRLSFANQHNSQTGKRTYQWFMHSRRVNQLGDFLLKLSTAHRSGMFWIHWETGGGGAFLERGGVQNCDIYWDP